MAQGLQQLREEAAAEEAEARNGEASDALDQPSPASRVDTPAARAPGEGLTLVVEGQTLTLTRTLTAALTPALIPDLTPALTPTLTLTLTPTPTPTPTLSP